MADSPRRWWPSSPESYFDLRPSDELYNAIDWGTILRQFFWGPDADDASNKRALRRQLPEVAPRSGDEDCAICLQHLASSSSSEEEEEEDEEEGATPRAMPCSHVFHERCIFQLVRHNRECPLCRKPQPQPQWHGYHYRDDDDDDRLQRTMPVPREMLEIEVL